MNQHMPLARPTSVAVFALAMAMAIAPASASTPGTTAHHFSSHPMISGTIATVNDHQVIVNTDQGEQVTLDVDSRTLAPRDVAPGMVMRAEFVAQPDCHFYAERIMPIRTGMSLTRDQAYANTHDTQAVMERNATSRNGSNRSDNLASTAAVTDTRETQTQTLREHSPGRVMTAVPATSDHVFSTRPMVSGRVVTANDHQLIVDTEQGQVVGLVMDSRTMVPGEVGPGSAVRAEFTPMKDGRFYATRVRTVGNGVVDREQAYAHTTDSELALAQSTTECGCMNSVTHNTQSTVYVEHRDTVQVFVAQATPRRAEPNPPLLPQTASDQPWLLLLGVLALGTGGGVLLLRSQRIA